MDDCAKWLSEILRKQGMLLCDTVRGEAVKQGFNRAQLKAARKELGVKCTNDWAANGETLNWFWYLEDGCNA